MINYIKNFWHQGWSDIREFIISPILRQSYYKRCFLLIVLGVILYIPLMNSYNANHDEQAAMLLFRYSWKEMFHLIAVEDGHPPLYHIVYRLFQLGGDYHNIFALRVATLVIFVLMALLGAFPLRRLVGEQASLWFIFCVFFLPSSLWLGTNMRMYPLTVYVLAGAFIYSVLLYRDNRKADWICFALFTIAGLYTHYFCALVLMLIWVTLFLRLLAIKQFRKALILCGVGCVIALLYLPWLYVFLQQYNNMKATWFPKTIHRDAALYGFLFLLRGTTNPLIDGLFLFLGCWCWILAIEYITEKKSGESVKIVKYGLFICWGLYLLTFVISCFFRPTLSARFLVVVMGIFYVTVAVSVNYYEKFKRVFLFFCSLAFLTGYLQYYMFVNDTNIKRFVSEFRMKIPEKSLVLYADTWTHLFMEFYLPEYHKLYVPLEPYIVLFQDKILKEQQIDPYEYSRIYYFRPRYISISARKYYAEELSELKSDLMLFNGYSGECLYLDRLEFGAAKRIIEKSRNILNSSMHK